MLGVGGGGGGGGGGGVGLGGGGGGGGGGGWVLSNCDKGDFLLIGAEIGVDRKQQNPSHFEW